MKHRKFALLTIMILMIVMLGAVAGNCNVTYDNEKSPLVIATQELDGVFSPFFSTSGSDSYVTGMTQIGMLGIDGESRTDYGDEVETVVRYVNEDPTDDRVGTQKTDNERYEDLYYTTYQFVIKNGIKFADGVELTYRDVLFNLYMYLDPVYNGSNTLYSTDILGLAAYRTQNPALSTTQFEKDIQNAALERVADFLRYYSNELGQGIDTDPADLQADLAELQRMFKEEELNSDWAVFAGSLDDYIKEYTSVSGKKLVTEVWQAYLVSWGVVAPELDIHGDDPTKYLDINYGNHAKKIDEIKAANKKKSAAVLEAAIKEYCINAVYSSFFANEGVFKTKSSDFISMTATGNSYAQYVSNLLKTEALKTDHKAVPTVEGITVKKMKAGEVFIDNKKGSSMSGEEEEVKETPITLDEDHYVLQIRIYGVDPKALLNFAFTVTPMHYYSNPSSSSGYNAEQHGWKNFACEVIGEDDPNNMLGEDEEQNFGFPYADVNYMNRVVKAVSGLPMGAGLYQPSNSRGDEDLKNVTALGANTGFYDSNIVYYVRNIHYHTVAKSENVYNATIKYLRLSVTNSTRLFDAVKTGTVHFSDPQAKQQTMDELNNPSRSGDLKAIKTRTNGYGYIGINAKYVQDLEIRQAIMHAMDTSLVKQYYPSSLVENIFRPMSKENWAYPHDVTTPFYDSTVAGEFNADYAKEKITELREKAGYTKEEKNCYSSVKYPSRKLEYTFTVAGGNSDHPAYLTMMTAAQLLNSCGFDVKVITDPFALRKLSAGRLTVWAAAWSSSIDPDMYQVYHKDSQATSILAWGYPSILGLRGETAQGTDIEKGIIERLSDYIDAARKTTKRAFRIETYAKALDEVMKLAVELPTYQRYDLYVYKSSVIDENTIISQEECTTYRGPLAELWKVSFVNG